jgi:hypothetical protein
VPAPGARALARDALAASLLICEAAGLAGAWLGRSGSALALHALVLPLAFTLVRCCRPESWHWLAALAPALLVLALPGVGALVLIFVMLPAWQRPRQDRSSILLDVGSSQELESGTVPAAAPRAIRDVLASSAGLAERLDAVLAVRRLPARSAVPILRLAFADHNEDVRLLAFADLERRESKLRARIQETRAALACAAELPSYGRAHLQHRLAQDHWELVDGGFVHGALELRVLERAAEFAEASLGSHSIGSAAVLLARVALRQRRPELAWRWLEEAERSGVSRAVSAPLFAEAAYLQRRFGAVGTLLGGALGRVPRSGLSPVLDFWTGSGAS